MTSSTLGIAFGPGVSHDRRRQLTYAAKTYAAIFGLAWDDAYPTARLCYGTSASRSGDVELRPTDRPYQITASPGDGLFLDDEAADYPTLSPTSGEPDWLSDIFAWIAAEGEVTSEDRDELGNVPFSATLSGRFGLDTEIPWASVAMRGLSRTVNRVVKDWPLSPTDAERPLVAATHDLDFLPLDRKSRMKRAAKNAAIALVVLRSLRLAAQVISSSSKFSDLLDVAHREQQLGIHSSAYVIAVHRHRRDGNYDVESEPVGRLFRGLKALGVEVGVHGSYESVLGSGSLIDEYRKVRSLGYPAHGGRQHWLRYRPAALFDALVKASAVYDASVGFNDHVGFRSGLAGAYIPYDFRRQAPYPLLELPVVLMDATLFDTDGFDAETARTRARRVMRRAALYGPGGVSIIWHNTGFHGVQLPSAIGELYWQLHSEAKNAAWVSGIEASRQLLHRFGRAGLAPSGDTDEFRTAR